MAKENQAAMSAELAAEIVLPVKEKASYVMALVPVMVSFMLPLAFLNFFWTNVLLIPAGVVGTFLMVCKLWDALNDPVESIIIDRTRSSKGRFRVWLIPAGFASSLCTILLFVKLPDSVPETARWFFGFGMYMIYQVAYSCTELPHLSLISTMTTSYTERGVLTGYRQLAASLIMTFINATALPLILAIGGTRNSASGHFWMIALFTCIAFPFYFIGYRGIVERVAPPPDEEKVPFFTSLKTLKGNVPAICLMGMMLSWGLSNGFGAGMFYFTYYVGNIAHSATFSTIGSIAGMLGSVAIIALMKVYPNKRMIGLVSWIASMVIFLVMYVVPVTNGTWGLPVFFALNFCRSFMAQLGFVICFSSFSDVSDYTTYKYKIRVNAFIVAISYFFWKFGTSMTTGVFNWGLGAMGYNAQYMDVWHGSGGCNPAALAAAIGNEATKNAWGFLNMDIGSFNNLISEVQANAASIIASCESSLSWIRLCMQVLPALLSIVGIVSFYFYKVDQEAQREALKGVTL